MPKVPYAQLFAPLEHVSARWPRETLQEPDLAKLEISSTMAFNVTTSVPDKEHSPNDKSSKTMTTIFKAISGKVEPNVALKYSECLGNNNRTNK